MLVRGTPPEFYDRNKSDNQTLMDFTQSALTVDKHREYLIGLAKEDITHVIKSVIFHIEKQNFCFKKINLGG